MPRSAHKRLREATRRSAVLAKLDATARELTGGALIVLVRRGDELLEVYPTGDEADLPEFCQVLRTTREGKTRCLTCRSLMSFGACYRGLIDYTCHGGVSVFAASVGQELADGSMPVVASCCFATSDPAQGWRDLRDYAEGLGIDLKRLRGAYRRLPRLTEDMRRLSRALVDITACVINEMVERMGQEHRVASAAPPAGERRGTSLSLEELLESALFVSDDRAPRRVRVAGRARLVDLVVAMVSRSPDMPFSVRKVARAARMSPNHFSTVFRRQTGKTFSAFLSEQRLALAERLLRDLTLDVGEVAARAGFRDNSYFARRFKKRTGMTPTQWRASL